MGKSTAVLRMLRTRLPESIPLIGVGGILSGADAATKMAAGATLVQMLHRPGLSRPGADRRMRRRDAPPQGSAEPRATCRRMTERRRMAQLPAGRERAARCAQHLRRGRARADAGRSRRCRGAAGTVRLRDAARRPGAGARRRQQPAVRRRSRRARCWRSARRSIAILEDDGETRDRPRRRRRRMARAGAVDAGPRPVPGWKTWR